MYPKIFDSFALLSEIFFLFLLFFCTIIRRTDKRALKPPQTPVRKNYRRFYVSDRFCEKDVVCQRHHPLRAEKCHTATIDGPAKGNYGALYRYTPSFLYIQQQLPRVILFCTYNNRNSTVGDNPW